MTKRPLKREEAYRVIDGERDYQDARYGTTASSGRPGNGSRTLDEYALYIEGYSRKLADIASTEINPNGKLDLVRKVAALCVACMEEHGAVERKK